MPVIQGQVGPPTNNSTPDGSNLPLLLGKQGETIQSPLHGKYYTQSYRGNTYWGSNAIGGTSLTIVTATTFVGLILWNPQGSNRLAVPMACTFTQTAAAGTGTGYGYGFLTPAGVGVATGAPISAFTTSVQRGSGLLNQSGGTLAGTSACVLADTATLTSAAKFMRGMGTGSGTVAITAPSVMPIVREDFDGSLIVGPNVALLIGLTVTSTITTCISLTWEEVPL